MSTTPARKRAYFNVPAGQQPLRVRDVRTRPEPQIESPTSVLEQLVIVPPTRMPLAAIHPDVDHGIDSQDYAASLDANNECRHGRLSGDRTPPCGCWPNEPAPARVPLAWPELEYPEPLPSVPDLIPDWVLADARDLRAGGMTWRKIARAVLPLTDCGDVPACEEILKLRLKAPSNQSEVTP